MILMRLTRRELDIIYNRIYSEAQEMLDKYHPCGICKENGHIICNRIKGENSLGEELVDVLCCVGCKYHSKEKGCTTKCLLCKCFLCFDARNRLPKRALNQWERRIELVSMLFDFRYYTPKDKTMKSGYVNEIIKIGTPYGYDSLIRKYLRKKKVD